MNKIKLFHLKSLQKAINNIKSNPTKNVISNMFLACACHDTEYHTHHCNVLEYWLRRNNYEY